jgi:membrane protein DedA with SNARE-associated domain
VRPLFRPGDRSGGKILIEETLETWAHQLESLPPLAVIATAAAAGFIETVFPPFPSETVLLVASFTAARQSTPPLTMILAAALGSFVSLYLLYWAGRGPLRNMVQKKIRKASSRTDDLASRLYTRWGYGVLLISRFLPAVRGPIAFMAGVYGLPPWRTAGVLLAACLIWYSLIVFIGMKAGEGWDGSAENLPAIAGGVIVAMLILWALCLLIRLAIKPKS